MLIEMRMVGNSSANIVVNIDDNTYRILGFEIAHGAPPDTLRWLSNTRWVIPRSVVANSYRIEW